MADKMSQNDFLKAISDAVKRKNAGEDPEIDPTPPGPRNLVLPGNPDDMQVSPAKPNPEATANAQLVQATRPGAMSLPSNGPAGYTPPPASNGINPDTGMPFYSPQQNQMSDDDKAKMQLKMQYLQNLQNTGGNSGQ